MMKTIGIAFFVLVSSFFTPVQDEIETITATYVGFADGEYYFTQQDGKEITFQGVKESARGIYDLMSNKYTDEKFEVEYSTKILREGGERPFYFHIITKIIKK